MTDTNGDGWPDVVLGINNAPLLTFENRGSDLGKPFWVRLRGKSGNPNAIGSRVSLRLDDGAVQTAEIYGGGGYLSQSPPAAVFGIPKGRQVAGIEVRWPDGKTSTATAADNAREIEVAQSQ